MEKSMKKSMKKSWFNFRLYLDGLRQLKIIGIMFAVIMACAAFLIPLGNNISNANYVVYLNGNPTAITGRVLSYDILSLNPLLVMTFLVVTPLMTLYLFNFINRRNACDFYHSIPDTRESIYISYGAAVLTWNICLLLGSTIISIVSAGILKYVEFKAANLFITLVNSIAACLFIYGVFMIAMSVTGTVFTNLSVAAMILIVPRLVVTVVIAIVSSSIAVIPFQFGDSIFDDRLNIVTNFFTGFFIRGSYQGIYQWNSLLYTFIVGLLYCAVGCILFKQRKSEAATCAAINSKLQCILRLIPAMMVCMIPIALIFDKIISYSSISDEEVFGIIVLYIIAVIGYFVYELITTRKLRNLIKAIPGLLWLVLYNVVFLAALLFSYNVLLNDVPKVQDVDSISLELDSNRYYGYYSNQDYYVDKLGDIALTSPEIKELIISELERNVEAIKECENIYNYGIVQDRDTYNYQNPMVLYVKIDCGLFNKYRNIFMSEPASRQIMELLANNEQVSELFYTTVDFNDISTIYLSNLDGEVPMETLYGLYKTFNEELSHTDFDVVFNTILGNSYDYNNYYGQLIINLKNGKRIRFAVTDQFENTMKEYFRIINEYAAGQEPADIFLTGYDTAAEVKVTDGTEIYGNGDIRFEVYSGSDSYVASAWYNYYTMQENGVVNLDCDFTENGEEILRKINEKLKKSTVTDYDGDILEVTFYGEFRDADGKSVEDMHIVRYYQPDEELVELIKYFGGFSPVAAVDEPEFETYALEGIFTGFTSDNDAVINVDGEEITFQLLNDAVMETLNGVKPGDMVAFTAEYEQLEGGYYLKLITEIQIVTVQAGEQATN